MRAQERISRSALAWILICLFAVVAPHIVRLPFWVVGIYMVAAVWRIMVFRGSWSFPGGPAKFLLALTSFAGVFASYRTLVSLEAAVALLLVAFALKLIELVRRKDAYVLLFLGYFVCLTEFLFSQDILITLYTFFTVVLITAALVALHQPDQHRFAMKPFRVASVMLLQALPLMIVLFFLFPRFGPLWTVPIKSGMAQTGMSDYMRPGDVAELSQSDEVAFRVKFEGEIPPKSQLYWRGLVFSRLQQGTWSALTHFEVPAEFRRPPSVDTAGDGPVRYSVIMEPTRQNWLYALQYARSSHGGVMQASDFRLFSPSPIESEIMYKVSSWRDAVVEPELTEWRRGVELRLPPRGDEKTRQLALAMRSEAASDQEFINSVLDMFSREPFTYTLKPGILPELDGMDHFLFNSRRGFCEHYSYAFVLMMRAAGLPARVVAGYQGGEINPVNKTVIVHQFDAHAWAEVWLPGRGWLRVDPTAAVAPERIEFGLEEAMSEEGSFLENAPLSPLRYRKLPLVNMLRLRYDAFTYRWQSWVVGFDNERQFELLHDMFGEISARVFIVLFLGSWALVLIPVSLSLLRRRALHEQSPEDASYREFCRRMASVGLARETGETPSQYALRIREARPEYAQTVDEITRRYTAMVYAGAEVAQEERARELAAFEQFVKGFTPNRRRAPNRDQIVFD